MSGNFGHFPQIYLHNLVNTIKGLAVAADNTPDIHTAANNNRTGMQTPQTHNSRSRLLVVDDIAMNRDLMTLQLQRHGYEVETAGSGPAALERVASGHFDLVLLDIRMPAMDGLEVLKRLREQYTPLALPVIMVTAEDLEENIIEALQIGANDYLVKPLNLSVAVARIESQLTLRRMATIKDDVVRFASHDLKKPLLVMLDIAQTLHDELQPGQPTPDDSRELLDLLLRTGHNMQEVVSGFLDQKELRDEEREPARQILDLNDVVLKSVIANSSYAERKDITLQHQLATSNPKIKGNEFRLLQVLDNLVGNALKFCPAKSAVSVQSRCDGDDIYVEIADNGPGLRDEDFDKLFIKHAKLSNRPTGNETSSGVGLAMCKQLIEMDEGHIGARNNPEQGATFWIKLPAS
jgi:signal transduction histidine kinase